MRTLFAGMLLALLPVLCAAKDCSQRDVMVAEMLAMKSAKSGYQLVINGKRVDQGRGLQAFSENCAKKLIALVDQDISFRQISDLYFYSGKIGTRLGSQNFFIFVVSPDRSRMTYIPGSGTVKYSNDPVTLGRLAEHPPEKDSFLGP